MKTCPAGCGRKPRSGCYLCTECWYALPREQRAEFNKTWRDYRRMLDSRRPAPVHTEADRKALINAVLRYRRVCDRAVEVALHQLMQPEAR